MSQISPKPVTPWIRRPLSPGASATLIPTRTFAERTKENAASVETVQKDSKLSIWRQCLRYRGRRSRSNPPERAAVLKVPEVLIDRPRGRGVGRARAPSSGAVVPAAAPLKAPVYNLKGKTDPRPRNGTSNTWRHRTTSARLASEAAPPPYCFRGQMLWPVDDKKERRKPVADKPAAAGDEDEDDAYFTAEEF